jgi:hypothetical protein
MRDVQRLWRRFRAGFIQGVGRGVGTWLFQSVGPKGLLLMVGLVLSTVGGYFRELPWVFISTLFLGTIAFVLLITSVLLEYSRTTPRKGQSEKLPGEFENVWSSPSLKQARDLFREMTNSAFNGWQKRVPVGGDLMKLVSAARMPGIFIGPHGSLSRYAERAVGGWSGDKKRLLDFCVALYPRQGASSLLTSAEWQAFHKLRQDLSKFWDEWGRKIFVDKLMDLNDIPLNIAKSQASQVVLLSYMEIAYARYTQEQSSGKSGLFELGKVWSHYLKD